MARRIEPFVLAFVAVASDVRASGGPCPGSPLVCVGSGSQTLVVAVELPPRALGVLVAGSQSIVGPVFGTGRWCIADPRLRLGSTVADGDGTAVLRLDGRPHPFAGAHVQLLWRDPLSGMTGATGIARLPIP